MGWNYLSILNLQLACWIDSNLVTTILLCGPSPFVLHSLARGCDSMGTRYSCCLTWSFLSWYRSWWIRVTIYTHAYFTGTGIIELSLKFSWSNRSVARHNTQKNTDGGGMIFLICTVFKGSTITSYDENYLNAYNANVTDTAITTEKTTTRENNNNQTSRLIVIASMLFTISTGVEILSLWTATAKFTQLLCLIIRDKWWLRYYIFREWPIITSIKIP